MLFRRRFLDGIVRGEITLAFRRWDKPAAKAGGRQRTPAGELEITGVREVPETAITAADARKAGYDSLEELLAELNAPGRRGRVYRIGLRYRGEDARKTLRVKTSLGPDEIAEIRARLDRLDRASRYGPWTRKALRLIAENPGTRAADLAAQMDRETLKFKTDVRKLKELGLTVSLAEEHKAGYRISPRGRELLKRL